MQEPYSLYVDEISPDEIKATVSHVESYFSNLRVLELLMPRPELFSRPKDIVVSIGFFRSYVGKKINGVHVLPLGRFVCMLTGSTGDRGMVLLDLIGKEELAEKIAEKLDHVDLRDRFMEVYEDILNHPENHWKCKLVVGKAPWFGGPHR